MHFDYNFYNLSSVDLCDICHENPDEVYIEDLAVCKKCEYNAKSIVWNRRYK